MSFFELFMHANLLVKIIMLILIFASIYSWAIIFTKRKEIKERKTSFNHFVVFFKKVDINSFYLKLKDRKNNKGIEKIFVNSINNFKNEKEINSFNEIITDEIRAEDLVMQKNMSMLATIGSISPYVGLIGTVIGIMDSFRSLATVKQATLAQVAPGISEALFATGIGLMVAIPASFAYNILVSKQEEIIEEYELFSKKINNKMKEFK